MSPGGSVRAVPPSLDAFTLTFGHRVREAVEGKPPCGGHLDTVRVDLVAHRLGDICSVLNPLTWPPLMNKHVYELNVRDLDAQFLANLATDSISGVFSPVYVSSRRLPVGGPRILGA